VSFSFSSLLFSLGDDEFKKRLMVFLLLPADIIKVRVFLFFLDSFEALFKGKLTLPSPFLVLSRRSHAARHFPVRLSSRLVCSSRSSGTDPFFLRRYANMYTVMPALQYLSEASHVMDECAPYSMRNCSFPVLSFFPLLSSSRLVFSSRLVSSRLVSSRLLSSPLLSSPLLPQTDSLLLLFLPSQLDSPTPPGQPSSASIPTSVQASPSPNGCSATTSSPSESTFVVSSPSESSKVSSVECIAGPSGGN